MSRRSAATASTCRIVTAGFVDLRGDREKEKAMSWASVLTKGERGNLAHCLRRWSEVQRVAAKQCRHCGGSIPCWSDFGDQTVGKRKSR